MAYDTSTKKVPSGLRKGKKHHEKEMGKKWTKYHHQPSCGVRMVLEMLVGSSKINIQNSTRNNEAKLINFLKMNGPPFVAFCPLLWIKIKGTTVRVSCTFVGTKLSFHSCIQLSLFGSHVIHHEE